MFNNLTLISNVQKVNPTSGINLKKGSDAFRVSGLTNIPESDPAFQIISEFILLVSAQVGISLSSNSLSSYMYWLHSKGEPTKRKR